MEVLLLATETVTILCVLLSIVYIVGIVWRVEEELDTSYKFFAFATVFFLIFELVSVYYTGNAPWYIAAEKISKMLFAILFLAGALCMRDIIRKLDGEK